MEFPNRWNDNALHYQKPSPEFIKAMMNQIEAVVEDFCKTYEIDIARIKMNPLAMEDVITRIDMRFLYFSVFHEGMKPNEYKTLSGLLIFWLLKRHPFWIDVLPGDEEDVVRLASRINEKIALHIIVTLLEEYNSDFFNHGEDLVDSYTREIEYSLLYRDLSKEALFLMFDPLYYEHIFANSYKEDSLVF
ncbi:MAG: hypothetical protein NC251_12260 [Lachnoclostridium sp.]|nr:hypothetical protein [Lachnospira sp.]MCM1249187.1 hypothetical protein [Lachnoclostridium sp.]MCM1536425.1 hypothetical protein [Clostridium sp.]